MRGYRRPRPTRPYFTKACFPSICPQTGQQIKRGDRIAYFPDTRKAYAENSDAGDQVRGLDFAEAYAMPDANY